MRTCPRDGTDLRKVRWESAHGPVDVDLCSKCRGVFLDDGELMTLTGSRRLQKLLHKHPKPDLKTGLVCPNCGKAMEGHRAGSAGVDVCPECFGLWLDGGELEDLRRSWSWQRKLRNSVHPTPGDRRPAKESRTPLTPSEVDRVLQDETPDPRMREAALDSLFTQWMVRNWTESVRFRGGL